MIPRVLSKYVQKSGLFLYPLLQIKRRGSINPLGTYIQIEGKPARFKRSLFVLHPARLDSDFRDFEKLQLTKSPCFRDLIKVGDEKIYVYDMAAHAADYDLFLAGKYSRMSESAKARIMAYQREPLRTGQEPSSNAAYIQTYLYPQDYHEIYADLLWNGEDPNRSEGMRSMMETCELCNPPDIQKEKLVVVNNKVEVLYSLR